MEPGDMPHDLIVTDPERGYWLRVRNAGGGVIMTKDLGVTLPGAVREARSLGHQPTHWVDRYGSLSRLPQSIV